MCLGAGNIYPERAANRLEGEAAVRQSVSRTRTLLGTKFASAGLDPEEGKNLVENIPWSGYRLRPDRVRVRYVADT
jgi:hypothetical protein